MEPEAVGKGDGLELKPQVQTVQLGLDVVSFASGFGAALARAGAPKLTSAKLGEAAPKTISFPIKRPRLKTRSHFFEAATAKVTEPPAAKQNRFTTAKGAPPANGETTPETDEPTKYTRIKPPKDIVKLEDRLFYMLQPPVEVWMKGESLSFPFKPFPYQFEGVAFLYPRYAALIADEMGLGKTMQTITTIRLLLRAGEVRRVLLVCPKPLVNNWQREFAVWAPEIPISTIEGDSNRRRWLWTLKDAPVTIANYECVVRDKDVLTEPDMVFDLCVIDEAQRIKNRDGNTAHVIRSIQRRRSWALTGTPVENCAEDLVGIFEYLAPGYLCPKMKPRQLGQLAGEFVIRRTKEAVLTDMPPKLYRDADIDLTPAQQESYRMAEDEGIVRLNEMGSEVNIQNVFELVLRLKQICNFDPVTGDSAKLERLESDLEEVAASGKQAIVFSQWVHTLERIAERLKRFNPLQYHGQIPSKQRAGIIDRFKQNKKHSVLLLSYGAGGVGLNIQFASYVFLFDRWWNPALEDQAINRAHRIGAAGPVTVTRFLIVDTIEQRIDQVLSDKRQLFDTILNSAEPQRNLGLSKAQVFGLFKLKGPGGAIDVAA